ncbi:MAG: Gfo/Idh/MocA family oxidoreductase [Steroidobacteraceae bacterium]
MNHSPIRVAIVGCGRIAHAHARAILALQREFRLTAAVDRDVDRARRFADQYGAAAACADLDIALARDDVHAVVLCTPNSLHATQAIAALEAGRHVLVEKPMAETVHDAERMADAAHRLDRVLAVGLTLRHSAPIRWLQDHRDDFGTLRAVSVANLVHWKGPQAPWWATRTPRQGLILSLFAPHALDFVQLVFQGEQADSVQCQAARLQADWQGEDEAMMILRYPQSRLAQIHLSYNQSFVVDRRCVHFERSMVRIEDGDYLYVDDELIIEPQLPASAMHRMGGRDFDHYFRTQLEEFAHAVHGQRHRCVLHDEGVRLTRLTQRALESALAAGATK